MVTNNTFNVHVTSLIQASTNQVFNAICQPNHLTNYFASKSTGPISQGAKITWTFEDAGVSCNVIVLTVVHNKTIEFEWNATGSAPKKVLIELESVENATKISIQEGFEYTPESIKHAMGQTQGWTDFICCLKAYLYGNINLRTGKVV